MTHQSRPASAGRGSPPAGVSSHDPRDSGRRPSVAVPQLVRSPKRRPRPPRRRSTAIGFARPSPSGASASPNARPISLLPVRRLSPMAQGGTSALTTAQPGTAPRGTATSGRRRDSNPSSCRKCSTSSGTSSGWNDWPHSPRHPRRPRHERRTAEWEKRKNLRKRAGSAPSPVPSG